MPVGRFRPLTRLLIAVAVLCVVEVHAKPDPGYGTAHPTMLQVVDPAGQWMVMCQARRDTDGDGKISSSFDDHHGTAMGDDVEPYLMLGPGAGQRIDDYVAHDPSGRWVAVIRAGRLILIDARKRKEWDLSKSGAVTDDVDPVFGPHAAASFDAAGQRCLYVRRTNERTFVVVRNLATNEEAVIDPGPGLFHRARIEPSGHWALIRVVAKDTDGNGKLELPYIHSSLSDRRCRGEVGAYSTFGRSGDDDVLRVARTSGGKAIEVKGLVAPIGEGLLCRRADGALVMRQNDGKQREVAAPGADALLYARAASTDAFVLAYVGKDGGRPLWLHKGSRSVKLPTARRTEVDEDTILHGRWWPHTHVTPEAGIADLERGVLVRTPGRAVRVHGDRMLLRRSSGLVIRDLVTGKEWPVPGAMEGSWRLQQTGAALAEAGRVIHLLDPKRSGTYEGTALAVTGDGRVLRGSAKKHGLVIGPLRWVRPATR